MVSGRANDIHLRILQLIDRASSITRRQIAAELDLGLSTVAKTVEELFACGLVEEGPPIESARGRPPRPIRLAPSAAYAVGLAVAGDYLTVVVVDLGGRVITRSKRATGVTTDKTDLVAQLKSIIEDTVDRAEIDRKLILGHGVGLHAPLDMQSGVSAGWPNTPEWSSLWEGLSLRDELAAPLGPNVLVGNANRFAALAEYRYGAARGTDSFFYVHIGRGVGGAAFLDGEPYHTLHGVSGEVGHITVDEDGPRCNCGNTGCLEALASIPALLHYARSRLQAGRESLLRRMCDGDWAQLAFPMIIEAANEGDKFSYDILNRCGEYAGIGIATALNLIGTELVLVRSEALEGQTIVLEAIRRTVILRALPIISRYARIERAAYAHEGPALGAATFVIERSFMPPSRIDELYGL